MEFALITSRYSLMDPEKPLQPPIVGAVLKDFDRIDERNVSDPADIPIYIEDPDGRRKAEEEWFKTGKLHRVEGGHIKRNFPDKCWFLEANLEDIVKLASRFNGLVVEPFAPNDSFMALRIY